MAAPALASMRAVASPSPDAPPVTSAPAPRISIVSLSSIVATPLSNAGD